MSDLAFLDTPAVLGRAEKLAEEDPFGERGERWSIVLELHRRGGLPVYEFLPLLEALLTSNPDAENVRLAIAECRRAPDH